jgi:nucleotide-binding universal stress UspA family protein
MTMSIVCGIDDSSGARTATRVAKRLAEEMGARLLLVNVSAPVAFVPTAAGTPGISTDEHGEYQRERDERARALLVSTAGDAGLDGVAELRVAVGEVAAALIDEARREEAMLIVVGSRGQGAILSAVLGSVSMALVRESCCPVVVVPAAREGRPP